jgi:hypothetical protein
MVAAPKIDPTNLRQVLARLLPGDGTWPNAGELELDGAVLEHLATMPELAEQVARALSALADDAVTQGGNALDEALKSVEAKHPDDFAGLLLAAYAAYYTDSRVRNVIEKVTGYEARPPQPLGYELPPFDEALLANMKNRKPFWRQV